MKFRKPMMVRMLDAVQGRFRRARPGSVLIMVVSLLVLLALIGTAAMSTSRLDRTGSLQNVKNVQVDLIAEGVKQMVLGVLTKDATKGNSVDSTVIDPDTGMNPIPNGTPLVDEANALLSSLVPERQLKWNAATPPTANEYVLQSVSYPPVQTGLEQLDPATGVRVGPYKIDVPNENSSDPILYGLPNSKPAMVPDAITVNGVVYPALRAKAPDGNWMTTFPQRDGKASNVTARIGSPFLAADTDGDGVADAVLVKLPITPINGITYYAAVRVVDNAAKINLNTATHADLEAASVAVHNGTTLTTANVSFAGIYPASVMLANLLDPATKDNTENNLTEFDKLNGQRVYGDRKWGPNAAAPGNVLTPYADSTGTARNDFVFLTVGDALHNQLGRRLDNPGIAGPNANQGGQLWRYGGGTRPFGIADAMALAYRFTLINPASQDSIVEKSLFMTVLNNNTSETKAYPLTTGGVQKWFYDNFDYRWLANAPADQGGWPASKTWLLRSLLTSFNPVSNAVPKGNARQGLYRMWYVGTQPGGNPLYRGYDALPTSFPNGNAVAPPSDAYVPPAILDPYDTTDPASTPYKQQPQRPVTLVAPNPAAYPDKANVNTAQFEELWQRYFDVMCENPTLSPFDAGAYDDIYQGSKFNHPAAAAAAAATAQNFGSLPGENASRMFRSPLRPEIPGAGSLGVARMHPYQVMALRAAIAAANTIAMRTDYDLPGTTMINDRDIPFFEIVLPQVDARNDHTTYNSASGRANLYAGVGATVYGVKRQPFITEVFLDNNTEQFPSATTLVTPPPTNPDGTVPRNKSGFAAIELYNPYDRPMRISGWKLGLVDRRQVDETGATVVDWADTANKKQPPKLQVIDIPANSGGTPPVPPLPATWTPTPASNNPPPTAPFLFDNTAVIPAHGYLVVSNLPPTALYNAANDEAAQYSPADTKVDALPAGTTSIYCEKLHWMIGRELVLLRPVERELFDTAKKSHGKFVVRWAPVDSFDATGMIHKKYDASAPPPPAGSPPPAAEEWHYVRSNDSTAGRAWHFVYPGRYEAVSGVIGHQQGIERVTWDPTAGGDLGLSPWVTPPVTPQTPWVRSPTLLGAADRYNSRDDGRDYPALHTADPANVVSTFPIQIANGDFSAQFNRAAVGGPAGLTLPLGGFMRAGDIMQVTFIGSYTIWDADANWVADLAPPFASPAPQPWSHAGQAPDPTTAIGPTAPMLAGAGGRFIEMNAVTMDAAFAEDTDQSDDYKPSTATALEDIGRFAPINFDLSVDGATVPAMDVNGWKFEDGQFSGQAVSDTFIVDGTLLQALYPSNFWNGWECVIYNYDQSDTSPWKVQVRYVTSWDKGTKTIKLNAPLTPQIPAPPSPPAPQPIYKFKLQRMRYGWASKLFDHFTTINSPGNDYLPNIDAPFWYAPLPEPVKNASDPSRRINRAGIPTEDDVPAEGLININTANWKTLAQLPLVLVMDPTAGHPIVDPAATEALAREIVYFRDVDDRRGVDPNNVANPQPPHPHGPFKSVHELCLIPDFVTAMNTVNTDGVVANNPGYNFGDYSPMTPAGDQVRADFKEKYLTLTRISNLVTTKSDSFTAYIQVQGWRDAGTADAKLAVQKRLSFIIDRSKVTTSGKTPTVYNVPVAE